MKSPNQRARILDVARAAGVSTASVSRALSNPSQVSDETREAVLKAVEQTGYRANRAARNLRTQKTGAILALIPNLSNPFFSQVISGIEQVASQAGYSILVADTENQSTPKIHVADVFTDGIADGVIILDGFMEPESIDSVRATGSENLVVYACEWAESVGLPSIRSDNAEGARLAARHLAECGHKRVGHICGPKDNILTPTRRDEFVKEARALGMEVRDEWILPGDFRLASGAAAAETILAMDQRPTGIFSASDMMALGFMKGLLAAGIKIPEEIALIGFDDVAIAAYMHPSLTTIRQNRVEIGRIAAKALLERIQNPNKDWEHFQHIVPVELVGRESTGPLPQK
ncbi:LacI family DNA-binding transcriptional regulator [Halocynthiibacter sp. C4]|uniref:LacI family DNA-binding transcriptional regulator n=1 Tax=Halocynthiibacter sp. C4 TaxID=2992758 RepID=UPI00237A15CE|nr:LacI family DNA-binding transcriptional regulator [Halocynthiibacter sp. C4]MDE0588622.1 LacI family DNA-binding transcriptional regulator [Halocynthiibacter sp. C4]